MSYLAFMGQVCLRQGRSEMENKKMSSIVTHGLWEALQVAVLMQCANPPAELISAPIEWIHN